MKKCLFSIILMLAIVSLSPPAFAQRVNRGPGLEVREDPSLDRSRGGRSGMMGGMRMGRTVDLESTMKSIDALEEQVAAIKKAIEESKPPSNPPQGNVDFRARMQKTRERTEKIQKAVTAIEDQVLALKGFQAVREFEIEQAKLREIAASATNEKASKTAELLNQLIEAQQKEFQEKAERLNIRMPGRRGGRGGPGGMMGGPGNMRGNNEPPN